MENRTKKLTKFEDIKNELEVLAIEYKYASKEKDQEAVDKINYKYNELKSKLTNDEYYYINMYNADELRRQMEQETEKEKREALVEEYRNKNEQKRKYESNKHYVKFVKNAKTIEDYANGKKDNRTFMQKTIKPTLLVATFLACTGFGYKLSSLINKNTQEIATEATTEENTGALIETLTTEEKTTEEAKKEQKTTEAAKKAKETVKIIENSNRGLGVNIINNSDINGKETIEALDPNVSNTPADTKTKVTETIIKETPVTEPKSQEYKFTENKNGYTIPEKEIVTITEKEERQETNTTDIKIEETTEPKSQEYNDTTETIYENGEKVTIVTIEETEETNTNNIPIEEETTQTPVQENNYVPEENIPEDEIVTITETEETEEVNIYNLPIDEDDAIINDLTEGRGYTLTLKYRG